MPDPLFDHIGDPWDEPDEDDDEATEEDCGTCSGTGGVFENPDDPMDHNTCDYCGGSGRIPVCPSGKDEAHG